MKKSILGVVAVLCILLTTACAQTNENYQLSGKIGGLKDGTKLELIPGATHKDEDPVASAIVTNGKFEFSGKQEEPRLFYLKVANHYGAISVMLENSNIRIKALANVNGDGVYFSEINVTGSKSHVLNNKKMAFKEELNLDYENYHKNHEAILSALNKAKKNKNKPMIDSLENTADYQAFAKAEKAFFAKVEKMTNETILLNKDSWWGPLVMLQSFSYFTDEQIPLYEQFSDIAKKSYYGQILKKELFPERLVNKQAPEFTLSDREGKYFSSTELMKGKKYILIDFWASWCGPCRREIPNLKHMYELYASKGLQIISISKDEDKKAWEKALNKENMAWPNLLNEKGVDDLYFVKTIPAIFLVDASTGKVLDDKLRGESLEKKLEELFR